MKALHIYFKMKYCMLSWNGVVENGMGCLEMRCAEMYWWGE